MSVNITFICLFRNGIERQAFLTCFTANANTFYIYLKCSDSVLILLCQSPNQFLNCLKKVEISAFQLFSVMYLLRSFYSVTVTVSRRRST